MDGRCVVYPVSDAGHKPASFSSQEFMLEFHNKAFERGERQEGSRPIDLRRSDIICQTRHNVLQTAQQPVQLMFFQLYIDLNDLATGTNEAREKKRAEGVSIQHFFLASNLSRIRSLLFENLFAPRPHFRNEVLRQEMPHIAA